MFAPRTSPFGQNMRASPFGSPPADLSRGGKGKGGKDAWLLQGLKKGLELGRVLNGKAASLDLATLAEMLRNPEQIRRHDPHSSSMIFPPPLTPQPSPNRPLSPQESATNRQSSALERSDSQKSERVPLELEGTTVVKPEPVLPSATLDQAEESLRRTLSQTGKKVDNMLVCTVKPMKVLTREEEVIARVPRFNYFQIEKIRAKPAERTETSREFG